MSGWGWYALGTPAAQGSKRMVGRGIMIESSKALRPWRDTMAAAAFGAGPKLEGPVAVRLVFTVPRSKSAKKADVVPFRRAGDLDKLARAALDSVVTAGLLNDDAQVADFWRLAKVYPGRAWDSEALPVPGVIMSATEILPGGDARVETWTLSIGAHNRAWTHYERNAS